MSVTDGVNDSKIKHIIDKHQQQDVYHAYAFCQHSNLTTSAAYLACVINTYVFTSLQYYIPEGSSLSLPFHTVPSQSHTVKLFRVLTSPRSSSSPVIVEDVSHLLVITADNGGCITVQAPPRGCYQVVAPAFWAQSASWSNRTPVIWVLPGVVVKVPAPAVAAIGSEATADSPSAATAVAGAAGGNHQPSIITARLLKPHGTLLGMLSSCGPSALLKPTPSQQLTITEAECRVDSGLRLQLTGTAQQLSQTHVLVWFTRFLPDTTSYSSVKAIGCDDDIGREEHCGLQLACR